MGMLQLPFPYALPHAGLLASMDEDDEPSGLFGLIDREDDGEPPLEGGNRLAQQARALGQQMVEPYVSFYQNSIVRPFYAGLDALAQTPFGDPAFYASIQAAGPPGTLIGGLGDVGVAGLRGLTALARRAGFGGAAPKAAVADNAVLLDSSVISKLNKAPDLSGRILDGEVPIVSYVTRPELNNAVLSGRGLRGVPHALDDLPVLSERPPLDARINIRGELKPNDRGRFGDGIIGAQAIENEIPLVTDDQKLLELIRRLGGVVR
jgi:predicted nucleic acid-binding protein